MNIKEFRRKAHEFADWIADYYENLEEYPVKSQVQPREIYNQLPEEAPEEGENIDAIFTDFKEIILPGITHWQSPNFFAYFPANASYPSILAEMLTAGLGAQCMIWETSPAAAELEEKMMNWLKKAMGIPLNWSGVIQDTASTASLCALLSARERFSNFEINENGFKNENNKEFRIYTSSQTHSSIEKAVKIAGFGKKNLVLIEVDEEFALIPEKLEEAIKNDIANGKIPLCVVASLGTTSSTAIDPLKKIADILEKYNNKDNNKHNIWLHVDAAYAGTATILPEFRWMLEGLEKADSYLFNPHKWMLVNFDCTAYFVKDKETLVRTFEILPEYLKTQTDGQNTNNYRDWGIQLGRRFRALKLWFVLRNFGLKGIRKKIRDHIQLAFNFKVLLEKYKKDTTTFEILAPLSMNLVCFRAKIEGKSEDELNILNQKLLENLNNTGKIYLTHTKLNGKYTLRMVFGQVNVLERHVQNAFELICKELEK
jgi:aromatic-L-amino-acid/L-tryptophan decarboxylase